MRDDPSANRDENTQTAADSGNNREQEDDRKGRSSESGHAETEGHGRNTGPADPLEDDHGDSHDGELANSQGGENSHTHDGDHSHAHDGEDSHTHDNGSGHSHGHGVGSTSSRKLAIVAVINLVGFVVELAGGLAFGSVALVSDAVHMLFDALAYVMAFAAAFVATRYDRNGSWSYGLHRIEPLAAFLNGLLLLPMVAYILWESYQRFVEPVAIGTGPTLAIAVGGLVVNVGSVYVLAGGEMSLNEKGAFYHLIGDAGGSVVVIVSVLAVELLGVQAVDPLAAVLIAGIVTWSALKVLRGSGEIFFLKSPVETDAVRASITAIDGVASVEDLHAWQVCSQITVATAHVAPDVETLEAAETVRSRVHGVLADHGVDHATVELCSLGDDRHTHVTEHSH